ncbi:hypothetical protein LV457_07440 [Mycobacterium sp. MYCO198283]|uniref:hypothetical protein n=1 Tax=Mycobacterium sp. MYCO198283 TaxID=2883505 RepID=UPI001E597ED3|nr:hypothetical protein [Mycobacterium sp. MYCO198283]MCG5432124.1 hypothetical protein [Mycobacterium sp. MYCO198283]
MRRTAMTVAAALLLAGCGTVTDGRPTAAPHTEAPPAGPTPATEPTVPTPRPTRSTPTPPRPSPSPPPAPPPTAEALAPQNGYVFIQTKSGKTRCQLSSAIVGCEAPFLDPPTVGGAPANGVRVTSNGSLTWTLGNLGAIPAVTLDYRSYSAVGWTIEADAAGTRFTNDATGHGMVVAVERVDAF